MKQISFIQRYAQLIELPTISSLVAEEDLSNRRLIELLATWLADFGFKTEILAVEGSHNKYNLLATYGEGEGGLLLAGHTDTVPFDEGKWRFNPFQLTEKAGKLYGLGTADMKGFFAFVVEVVSQLDLTQIKSRFAFLPPLMKKPQCWGQEPLLSTATFAPIVRLLASRPRSNRFEPTKGILANRFALPAEADTPATPPKALMRLN